MRQVPRPRFDLLKMNRYAFGSVQFSRGCPFLCEFCDIIVMYGRRPRIKSVGQIIAELEALRAQQQDCVFIVDDNFIGDKKAIKQILARIIEWQHANGYPLDFITEVSLDLADDDELMRLMVDANILSVFVGIESPNEESLRETRKLQNVRVGGTMIEKVHRIQRAGMEVWAGMILGFDNDDETIFEDQRKFLDNARINIAMVGMLSAIPSTPLHARLLSAGRLDLTDSPIFGSNVMPLKMSREALSKGYVQLMADLYHPKAFFKRVDDLISPEYSRSAVVGTPTLRNIHGKGISDIFGPGWRPASFLCVFCYASPTGRCVGFIANSSVALLGMAAGIPSQSTSMLLNAPSIITCTI